MSAQMQVVVAQVRSRAWLRTLRTPETFAHPTKFSRPRTIKEASARLEVNLSYFLTNYALLSVLVFALVLLAHPFLVVVGLLVAAMWLYVSSLPEVRVPIGGENNAGFVLEGKNKMAALTAASALIVFITAGSAIFLVIGLSTTLVLAHAIFHEIADVNSDDAVELSPGDEVAVV